MKRTAVVGIGNIILGDEGVGIHVLNRLRLEKLPKEVELIEGGVGGIALLNLIKGVERAIFIDAVAGDKPGKIHRFTETDLDQKVKVSLHPMSLHDIGLAEMIKLGRTLYPDEMPKEIVVYGVEITELKTYSTALSKKISVSAKEVVKLIVDDLTGKLRLK
jgi:hydrogenase maturation protease